MPVGANSVDHAPSNCQYSAIRSVPSLINSTPVWHTAAKILDPENHDANPCPSRWHWRRRHRLLHPVPPVQAWLDDVVLLERDELTSGSTWHAAANIHGLHNSTNISRLQHYDELISKTRSRALIHKVRAGMPDDYALGIFSDVIGNIRKDIADFDLEIVCDLSANLVAALQRQDLDIALATLAAPPSSARFMIEAKPNWVFPPDFKRTVDSPVALSAYPEGCVFRKAMITSLETNLIPWRVASQIKSRSGVIAAVRAGTAITVMAQGTAPPDLMAAGEFSWTSEAPQHPNLHDARQWPRKCSHCKN